MSTITAGDLTLAHVGQVVTIEAAGATVTGRLRAFEVKTDWITTTTFAGDREPVPGRQSARLVVGRWVASDLPLSTEVVVA